MGTTLMSPYCSNLSTHAAKIMQVKFYIMYCIFNFYYILLCPQQDIFWSESSRPNLICSSCWRNFWHRKYFQSRGTCSILFPNPQRGALVQICQIHGFMTMLRCRSMCLNFKFMLHFLEPFLKKQKGKTGILIMVLLPLKHSAVGFYNSNMMDRHLNGKAN